MGMTPDPTRVFDFTLLTPNPGTAHVAVRFDHGKCGPTHLQLRPKWSDLCTIRVRHGLTQPYTVGMAYKRTVTGVILALEYLEQRYTGYTLLEAELPMPDGSYEGEMCRVLGS